MGYAKGFVQYHCGSLGLTGDAMRYMRMMSGNGYIVFSPDLTAHPGAAAMDLRSRTPRKALSLPSDFTDYWDNFMLFEDLHVRGRLVYTSCADDFISDPERWSALYASILTLRQAEITHVLRRLPPQTRRNGVFLLGSSEGAAAISGFREQHLGDVVLGRIIIGYPCEDTFWTYFRPEDAGIAGDRDVPTLNLMGVHDKFFGRTESIANTIVEACDLPPIKGHGYDAMVKEKLTAGLVVHLEGAEQNPKP
mmetsp:Transcript_46125/g.147601  ORF Transcript_46125/g.147601 Transcript_46125/m.147601 type:complete len:250 (-) Transcript_46125:8-757(-)